MSDRYNLTKGRRVLTLPALVAVLVFFCRPMTWWSCRSQAPPARSLRRQKGTLEPRIVASVSRGSGVKGDWSQRYPPWIWMLPIRWRLTGSSGRVWALTLCAVIGSSSLSACDPGGETALGPPQQPVAEVIERGVSTDTEAFHRATELLDGALRQTTDTDRMDDDRSVKILLVRRINQQSAGERPSSVEFQEFRSDRPEEWKRGLEETLSRLRSSMESDPNPDFGANVGASASCTGNLSEGWTWAEYYPWTRSFYIAGFTSATARTALANSMLLQFAPWPEPLPDLGNYPYTEYHDDASCSRALHTDYLIRIGGLSPGFWNTYTETAHINESTNPNQMFWTWVDLTISVPPKGGLPQPNPFPS